MDSSLAAKCVRRRLWRPAEQGRGANGGGRVCDGGRDETTVGDWDDQWSAAGRERGRQSLKERVVAVRVGCDAVKRTGVQNQGPEQAMQRNAVCSQTGHQPQPREGERERRERSRRCKRPSRTCLRQLVGDDELPCGRCNVVCGEIGVGPAGIECQQLSLGAVDSQWMDDYLVEPDKPFFGAKGVRRQGQWAKQAGQLPR